MRFLVSLSLPSNKMERQCSREWAKGTMTTWLFLTNLLKKEGWDLSENRFKWKEFESKLLTMKQFKCSCDASLMFKRPGAVAIQQALPCHFFFPFIVQKFIYHVFNCQHGKQIYLQLDPREWKLLEILGFTVPRLEAQVTKELCCFTGCRHRLCYKELQYQRNALPHSLAKQTWTWTVKGAKNHTEQIPHQNPQSELLQAQHITLSSSSNSDLILKWSFSNTELLKYFQQD